MRKFKAFIQAKKQSGGARRKFEYFEEMHEVLKDRHDIYPPVLLGNNVAEDNVLVSDPRNAKMETTATAGTKKRDSNELNDSPSSLKKKKTASDTLDTVLVKHLETMITIQDRHAANEDRRLDLMEKLINNMSKNN